MGWKKDYPNLRARLVKQTKSPSALDKQVQRLANKLGVTPEEAVFILAKQKGVSYQADFKKLSHEQQRNVGSARTSSTGNTTHIVRNTPSKVIKGWHERWWGIILTNATAGIIVGIILWIIFK